MMDDDNMLAEYQDELKRAEPKPDVLPDIEINVKHATQFRGPDDETYRMGKPLKGFALIINNQNFKYEERRYGSERDYVYLQRLFEGLGYAVVPYEDLSGFDMLTILTNFAGMTDHKDVDSCVVCINTHGLGRNQIQGIDGEVLDLDFDVTSLFNNSKCKALKNKPKLFFMQACRGGERDEGTDGRRVEEHLPDVTETIEKERTPSWSDMMIVHSTVPGYVSNRHGCEGSWFVQSLVKTFMDDAWNADIETMMKTVTKSVMKYKTYSDEMQSPEVVLRGWTKKLYFNPGLDQD